MTVVGIDDTDAREEGMCTTYVGVQVAGRLAELGAVDRLVLVRLNPAVPHKTRGNAAVAIHTNVPVETAIAVATEVVESLAVADVDGTNPGVVAVDSVPTGVPEFTHSAIRHQLAIDDATELIDRTGAQSSWMGSGRGRIGALAAVGGWTALEEWTYEHITYRERDRWGTPRSVNEDAVRAAADAAYPTVWDTVDRETDEIVCVPHTPGPVLYGIRGDDPDVVERTAAAVDAESITDSATFVTNQGTDAHLQEGTIGDLEDGRSYRVTGQVADRPRNAAGGHVFLSLTDDNGSIECVAFEPTKHFRRHVRSLLPGDRVTVCGEVADGTLKLEKFAVRDLVEETSRNPRCETCGTSMESAGREQGYRCRSCEETASAKVTEPLERSLEPGWYEVPPRARRHIAKPLVRGGFTGDLHPER